MAAIDLRADLNAEDDEGRWWSLRSDARHRRRPVPDVRRVVLDDLVTRRTRRPRHGRQLTRH